VVSAARQTEINFCPNQVFSHAFFIHFSIINLYFCVFRMKQVKKYLKGNFLLTGDGYREPKKGSLGL
jgi:hypothetical protein